MNRRQVSDLLEQYASGEWHGLLTMVRDALDNYPRIKASPDFDFRVLEAVMARTARSRSLLDRLDALFARPLYKLLGASTLGIVIALLTASVLVLPYAHQFRTSALFDVAPTQLPTPLTRSRGLYAFDRWWFDDDNAVGTRNELRDYKQPQRRKSSWDANTSGLSYSRQSGSWC